MGFSLFRGLFGSSVRRRSAFKSRRCGTKQKGGEWAVLGYLDSPHPPKESERPERRRKVPPYRSVRPTDQGPGTRERRGLAQQWAPPWPAKHPNCAPMPPKRLPERLPRCESRVLIRVRVPWGGGGGGVQQHRPRNKEGPVECCGIEGSSMGPSAMRSLDYAQKGHRTARGTQVAIKHQRGTWCQVLASVPLVSTHTPHGLHTPGPPAPCTLHPAPGPGVWT